MTDTWLMIITILTITIMMMMMITTILTTWLARWSHRLQNVSFGTAGLARRNSSFCVMLYKEKLFKKTVTCLIPSSWKIGIKLVRQKFKVSVTALVNFRIISRVSSHSEYNFKSINIYSHTASLQRLLLLHSFRAISRIYKSPRPRCTLFII